MKNTEELKFSEGPWIVSDGLRVSQQGAGLMVVAEAHCGAKGPLRVAEMRANAALIAAAPDMYEVLRQIAHECNGDGHFPLMGYVLDAMAKARGEIEENPESLS